MSPTFRSYFTDDAPKIFFDLETPNWSSDRICSYCAMLESGETFSSLVDPETYFHPVNVSIHGITSDMVYGKPNFRAVWENELAAQFEGRIVVGYNVTFDLRVLAKTLLAYNLPMPVWRYIDVLPAARKFFDLPHYSLSDVMDELGVSFRHHDANEDVMATKIAYERIMEDAPELFTERIFQFEGDSRARW